MQCTNVCFSAIVEKIHSKFKLPPVISFFFQCTIFHNFGDEGSKFLESPQLHILPKISICRQFCSYLVFFSSVFHKFCPDCANTLEPIISALNIMNSPFVTCHIGLKCFSLRFLFSQLIICCSVRTSSSSLPGHNAQNDFAKSSSLNSEFKF